MRRLSLSLFRSFRAIPIGFLLLLGALLLESGCNFSTFSSKNPSNLNGQGGSPSLIALRVSPASISVTKGTSQYYTAQGIFSDGSTQDLTSSVSWATDQSSVATIELTGLATTVGAGSASITASLGDITSPPAALAVTSASLVSIALTPTAASIPKGLTQTFQAVGTYSDHSTLDLTSTVQWVSNDPSVCVVSAGVATGTGLGTAVLSARVGNVASSGVSLTVTAPTLQSIALSPSSVSLAKGATQQFSVTGTYSDGSTLTISDAVGWSSSDSSIVSINATGLAIAAATGTAQITATYGSLSANTSFTVGPATLVSISLSPPTASISVGATQQFTATGTYTDGSTESLTSLVNWSSSDSFAATVVRNTGVATGLAGGKTTITIAAYKGVSATQTATLSIKSGPIQICSVADLESLPNPAPDTYLLTCDIDFAGKIWRPIILAGTFDGQGHTISNFVVSGDYSDGNVYSGTAFFSQIETGASVKNLKLNGSVSGLGSVGMMAGLLSGTIIHSSVTGSIAIQSAPPGQSIETFTGGLVGEMSGGDIETSSSSLFIRVPDGVYNVVTGGLVGYALNTSNISNSYAIDGARATSDDSIQAVLVGGVGGTLTVTNCYYSSADFGYGPAGIIGNGNTATITSSYYFEFLNCVKSSAGGACQTMAQSVFQGWDFVNTWKFLNDGPPTLQ